MTKFLVVFDVDSTLIKDEVIELLADVAGKRAEVAAVTEAAMRGELDFAQSLTERVKTLAGLPSSVFDKVLSQISYTDGLEETLAAIHEKGGLAGAVSGGFSQILTPLAKKLGLDFQLANELEVTDGVLTGKVVGDIVDSRVKAQSLKNWADACGVDLSKTIAVGDGANDLEMIALAGLGVAFNAKPIVQERADVVIAKPDLRELISLF